AVGTTVDPSRGGENVFPVCHRHIRLPERHGNAGCVLGLGCQSRIGLEPQANFFSHGAIVVAASQLDVSAAAVAVTVSRFVIAHAGAIHEFGENFGPSAHGLE